MALIIHFDMTGLAPLLATVRPAGFTSQHRNSKFANCPPEARLVYLEIFLALCDRPGLHQNHATRHQPAGDLGARSAPFDVRWRVQYCFLRATPTS